MFVLKCHIVMLLLGTKIVIYVPNFVSALGYAFIGLLEHTCWKGNDDSRPTLADIHHRYLGSSIKLLF